MREASVLGRLVCLSHGSVRGVPKERHKHRVVIV